ncbi:rhomboid-like protein [Kocuria massiliensis]|uniref:rhomboid-like protein n=1 Tax=Kocuria massiliensis TaxID=1926282 RepID=UPI000A1CAB04|nr:rhomboid-like protein [Kocuria massiliensis]MCT1367058.1 hypothetical protein [Rothia sp. p3-SID1597]
MLLTLIRMATAILIVFVIVSLANDWRLTRPIANLWRRHSGYVRWYITSAPATYIYMFILIITTWVLLGMPEFARDDFLKGQSTNLQHLTTNPIRALVRSAFFVSSAELLTWVALFGLLLAPAERWLGTARTIAVFAVGHVVSTAGAALDVWIHIRYFHFSERLWNVEDTGASYGFMSLAALLFYRLRGWTRWVLGAALAVVLVYGAIEGTGFTARGHAIAVLLGLALYPMSRVPDVVARLGTGRSIVDLWKRRTADGSADTRAEFAAASRARRARSGRRQADT